MTTLDILPNDILNIIFGFLAQTDEHSSYVMLSLTDRRFHQLINTLTKTTYVCPNEIAYHGYLDILKRTKICRGIWNFNEKLDKNINCVWYWAAKGGHLDILEWAWENAYSFSPLVCAGAAEGGHLDVLMWARLHDCPWNSKTYAGAARNAHINVLEWVKLHGCPCDPNVCAQAARNGHLDVLKWARSNGCPWNSRTCEKAAKYGHIHVLKWARSNGCPYGDVRRYASMSGQLHILKYLKEQGIVISNLTAIRAAKNGHLNVVRWTKEIGVKWSNKTKRIVEMKWPMEFK